jgi:ssDNA-binding Zn-finger/Zn-ribbon topoisomerase 1
VYPINVNYILNKKGENLMGSPSLECGCKSQIVLKAKKDNKGFLIGCRAFPACKASIWLPTSIKGATATNEYCSKVKMNLGGLFRVLVN